MKKKVCLLIMLFMTIIFIPKQVNAVEISADGKIYTYNVCNDGCEYTEIPQIKYYELPEKSTVIIKVGEGVYQSYQDYFEVEDVNLIIEGISEETSKVKVEELWIENCKNVTIKNISFEEISLSEVWNFMRLWAADNVYIENVNITGDFENGITVESATENSKGIFKNINIKGSKNYAIAIGKSAPYQEKSYKIIDSNLIENNCSVIIDLNTFAAQPKRNKMLKPQVKLLSEKDRIYNVTLENNSINCILSAKDENLALTPPVVYVSPTNKWEQTPTKNENIFEVNGGKVYVEQASKQKFLLETKEKKKITELFEGVNVENAIWENSNPKVAVIENDEIIPLSVGTTEFSTEISEIEYKIDVEVTSDMIKEEIKKPQEQIKNPLTSTSYLISFIGLIIIIGYQIVYRKKEEKYEKNN